MASKEATYAIKGLPVPKDPAGAVPLRMEVDDWYMSKDPEHKLQVTMFIRALAHFQQMSPEEKLSYFQIAGIHGFPYIPWDEDVSAKSPLVGYCTHDSLLFATWHRVYMLLFEQRLYEIMKTEIISGYDKDLQDKMNAALSTWRMPYWDWAAKKKRGEDWIYDVPLIVKDREIKVLGVLREEVPVTNPMYKYNLPDHAVMGMLGIGDTQDQQADGGYITVAYSRANGTSRWATRPTQTVKVSNVWVEGQVNNDLITKELNHPEWYSDPKWHDPPDNVAIGELVYRLFLPQYLSKFSEFVTTRAFESKKSPTWLSLEYIHNNMHDWVGGVGAKYTGHMNSVPVAAFDPIFWMHHCNIDRLCAIWQALNEDNKNNWFDTVLKDHGTWGIKPKTHDKPDTPLAPFHRDEEGTYFISDDVKDWTRWGYAYPELQSWNFPDKHAYRTDIKERVRKLYAPPLWDQYEHDYIVNVKYKRFALNGIPYTIHFFLQGDATQSAELKPRQEVLAQRVAALSTADDSPSLPLRDKDYVGFVYNFSTPFSPDPTFRGCVNCKARATEDAWSTGQVPITSTLLARIATGYAGAAGSITDKSDIAALLKEKLSWKVITNGGYEVPIPQDPADSFIEVSVAVGKRYFTTPAPDAEPQPPGFTGYETLLDVTHGKAGGEHHSE